MFVVFPGAKHKKSELAIKKDIELRLYLSIDSDKGKWTFLSCKLTPLSSTWALIAAKLDTETEEEVDPNDELVSNTTDSGTENESKPPLLIPTKFSAGNGSEWPNPESDEFPFCITLALLLSASKNHDSDFGSWRTDPGESGLEGKRNNRMREGVGVAGRLSYSSNILRRSSSVVSEIRESRSWCGSWYLRVNWYGIWRVWESWVVRAERLAVARRSTATMRVSPPA